MMEHLDEAGRFLSEYAATLLSSGATCARVEKNVGRMSGRWGFASAITILPRHVTLSLEAQDGETKTFLYETGHANVSFDKITRLSRLSWNVADNGLDISNARQVFLEIAHVAPANSLWVLFAVSCANSAFCRLFSGDAMASLVVFFATMCGYYMKQVMLARKVDVRLVFIVCAFVSSVLACGDSLFALGGTPEIAIGTSVLYLVPGIPFLNSFSDMLDRHYICFFCRLTDTVVLTCCLSAGLCAGMWMMHVGMF